MRRPLTALMTLLLAGCAVGPDYQRPQAEPPAAFRGRDQAEAASLADQPWWDVFQDPALKALVAEALKNNANARIASWRVEEYRARAGVARADWYPAIAPTALWERGRGSTFSAQGHNLGDAFELQAAVSWELDLWGRIRRSNEAAGALLLGSEDARRGVYLSTVAEVANAYFQLRELDHRLEIARATSAAFRETLDLFDRRLKGGAASALETSRAQAALFSATATIPNLERQIAAQENLLSFLLGRAPGPIARGAGIQGQVLPPAIPAGIPLALLERRPDLREAEHALTAANAYVGVAKANRLPALSLTGLFGGIAPETAQMFGTGKEWLISPGLTGPLFQGGRLKRQQEIAIAQYEQARARWQGAVLSAYGEVSSALVAYQKYADVEREQAQAVTALKGAVALANLRYSAGLSNYLEVLDAQQQLLPAENALSTARLARLETLVQVYKALGGGWNLKDPAATAP